MNDALAVRRIKSIRNLHRVFEQLLDGHGTFRQLMFQCLPGEHFHDDELLAACFADFVDCADIWMVQRRRGEGLAPETVERLRIMG